MLEIINSDKIENVEDMVERYPDSMLLILGSSDIYDGDVLTGKLYAVCKDGSALSDLTKLYKELRSKSIDAYYYGKCDISVDIEDDDDYDDFDPCAGGCAGCPYFCADCLE